MKTGKNASKRVHTLRLKKLIEAQTDRNLLVWLEAYDGKTLVAENLVTFARPKHLELSQEPSVVATVKAGKRGSYKVTLKAKAAALWTWIEIDGTDFRADDNFVHLRPGMSRTIEVTPSGKLAVAALQKKLRVRSLTDLSRE